jgi:hypothetical protein
VDQKKLGENVTCMSQMHVTCGTYTPHIHVYGSTPGSAACIHVHVM